LFTNCDAIKEKHYNAVALKSGSEIAHITNIEIKENFWIYVTCKPMKNMEKFKYPNVLEVIK